MQNTLILLSPLDATPFDTHSGIMAALALKSAGTRRADISTDPRLSFAEAHGAYALPVANIDKSARVLAEQVFRPVLGQSDAIFLDSLAARKMPMPTLENLSRAGEILAQIALGPNAGKIMALNDGRDLGLVLFLAFHAKTASNKPYDGLVHARLTHAAQSALNSLSTYIVGQTLGSYGTTVNLGALRRTLAKIHGANVITRTFDEPAATADVTGLNAPRPN